MAAQGTKKNKHPVLRMPLDLSLTIDSEVHQILNGFKSGVEAKNFICSAVLYYTRSPLVLSANAIVDALGRANLSDWFGRVLNKLDDIDKKMNNSVIESCNKIDDSSMYISNAPEENRALISLKQKFKV